ncbi:MAG TPA: hypothetical protein VER96_35930 [Polyangiaceae bacterium]|nr:hypothetical protein [Polyangiaceae bacterium]
MLRRFWNGQRLVALRCAGIAFALFMAGRAAAQARPRYAVKWSTAERADGCLQQSELTAEVAKLVSADQLSTAEQADRVIFGVAQHDESWHATLTVVDSAGKALGERELKSDAASCSELSASVALGIALIIDPDHIPAAARTSAKPGAALAPATAPPAASAAPVASPAVVPVAPAPTAQESPVRVVEFSPRPQRVLKASAVLASGLLPEPAIGAQLEFWQPIASANALRFSVAYFGAQTLEIPEHPGAGAKMYLVTARAAYCPLLAANPRVSVFGCAGLESGLMVAHGEGGGYDDTAIHGLLALDGALTVNRSLGGPWALSLTGGAAVTPVRPQFSYQTSSGAIDVYRRSALEGRLELGLAYQF